MIKFFNIKGLRKFLGLGSETLGIEKKELLSDTEALRVFASLWTEYKVDVMTMLTVLEYEYMQEGKFNHEQFEAYRKALGDVAMYLKGCEREYLDMKAKQTKRD